MRDIVTDLKKRKSLLVAVGGLIAGCLVLTLGFYQWHAALTVSSGHREVEGVAEPTLAVLPFVDLDAGRHEDDLADGLPQDLLRRLSEVPGLHVAGPISSSSFKGKAESVRAAGRSLGVGNLLQGGISTAEGKLRVTVRLVSSVDGSVIWYMIYDRHMPDIFDIEDDITKSVVDALALRSRDGDWDHEPGMTRNVDAFREYLKGLEPLDEHRLDGYRSAAVQFEKAVDLDPTFVIAWQRLGYASLEAVRLDPPNLHDTSWRARIARAQAYLEDGAPEAHRTLIFSALSDEMYGRWEFAGLTLRKLLDGRTILPVDTAEAYGRFLLATGRPTDAIVPLRAYVTDEPLDPRGYERLSAALDGADRTDAALKTLNDGQSRLGREAAAFDRARLPIVLANGDTSAIAPLLDRLIKTDDTARTINIAVRPLLNDKPAARAKLRHLAADADRTNSVTLKSIAAWAAYFDDPELALKSFERIPFETSTVDSYQVWRPLYRDMRKLPGFKTYLLQTGLAYYWRTDSHGNEFCHPAGGNNVHCN